MGIALNTGTQRVRRGRGRRLHPISDINVTPFVDIVLVLLVIFMITAPIIYSGLTIRLPRTTKVVKIRPSKNQVILSLTQTNEYYIGKEKYLFQELPKMILSEFTRLSENILYLQADENIRYGPVAELLAHLKTNGIHNIALVTEIKSEK